MLCRTYFESRYKDTRLNSYNVFWTRDVFENNFFYGYVASSTVHFLNKILFVLDNFFFSVDFCTKKNACLFWTKLLIKTTANLQNHMKFHKSDSKPWPTFLSQKVSISFQSCVCPVSILSTDLLKDF